MSNARITQHDLASLPCIHEGRNSMLYKKADYSAGKPAIIKILRRDYFSQREIERLKNEYDIAGNLDIASSRRAYQRIVIEGRPALILEYIEGRTLRDALAAGLSLDEILSISISIAEALGRIHRRRIFHGSISDTNIIIRPGDQSAVLIDFGAASLEGSKVSDYDSPDTIESLHYISPEQTGRTVHSIDCRSDLYSLGVLLYQMLTGAMPFTASTISEMIHCHIARNPAPADKVNAEIPGILSDMAMKLMEKNTEARYQSAFGVKADLENCLAQLRNKGFIELFGLAAEDLPTVLKIPDRLYGRDQELQALSEAYRRVSGGAFEIVLISGDTGSGKSSLLQSLRKHIEEKGGYFVSGRYDEYQRNTPYYGLTQAYTECADLMLRESSARLSEWKKDITQTLGSGCGLLTEVIPRLELVIGEQPPAPDLGLAEARNRFHKVFQSFVKLLARKQHPFVICLDNLQWIDEASLDALKLQAAVSENQYLMIIGAFRDTDSGLSRKLISALTGLNQSKIVVTEVHLGSFSHMQLSALVSDTLKCSSERAGRLSEMIFEKTGGNPLFAVQLLKTLYEEALLDFNHEERQWEWNAESIQKMEVTKSVAELMIQKIERLPLETRDLLSLAACIGNSFDMGILAVVAGRSGQEAYDALRPAIDEGLIVTSGRDSDTSSSEASAQTDPVRRCEFLHDRVRKASDAFIQKKQRKMAHLSTGRLLLARLKASEVEDEIFDITDHFNEGFRYITDEGEKLRLIELNLAAGRKAKREAASHAAIWYFSMGTGMLPADKWERHYDLTLSLYMEALEAEYLSGNFERAELLAAEILQHAEDLLVRVRVYELRVLFCAAQNRNSEAIKAGMEALDLLDISLPSEPAVMKEYADRLREELRGEIGRIDDLAEMTVLQDELLLASMRILMNMAAPAHQTYPELLTVIILKMVLLSVRKGNSPMSAFAYGWYAFLLCSSFNDIEKGYQFGQLSVRMLKQFSMGELEARIIFIFNAFVRHWKEYARETLRPLLEVYQRGIDSRDPEYACNGAVHYCSYIFLTGGSLEYIHKRQVEFIETVERLRLEFHGWFLRIWGQAVLNLQGKSADPCRLTGEMLDESEMLPVWIEQKSSTLVFCTLCCRMMLQYLFRDYAGALSSAELAQKFIQGGEGYIYIAEYMFYHALSMLAAYPEASGELKTEYLARVEKIQKRMEHWAAHAPANFLHKANLIAAEKARVTGDTLEALDQYDRAIKGAKENGYIMEEAVAYERGAEFLFAMQKEEFASLYIRKARDCHRLWGASGKAEDIEKRHEFLMIREKPASTDAAAIIQASRTLSQEIRLEQLLDRMMRIVIENAGAEKGILIENRGDRLTVQARGQVGQEQVQTMQQIPVEESAEVPISVINYVARTHSPVVLDDAYHESSFANDSYIAEHRTKSLLCLPIVHQGKLTGLLYLENSLTANVFTPDRLELLKALSSQAAISMQNAALYASLEKTIAELRHAEEMLRLNADRMAALLRLNQMTEATIDEMVSYVLEEAVRLTKSRLSYLVFLDVDETVLKIHSWPPDEPQSQHLHPHEAEGLWREAVRQRRPVFTNDSGAPETPGKGLSEDLVRTGRHLNVPVAAGNHIVLAAGVGNRDEPYDYVDAQQLTLLMEGMWRLIERNRSENEIRELTKSLEQKVTERTVQLEAANRELEAFVYSISHDLRSPLRSIDGFSLAIMEEYQDRLDEAGMDYLSRVRKATQHMGMLIDDLLRLSRITRADMRYENVILSEMVAEIAVDLREKETERRISLVIEPDVHANGDPSLLRIALENLLGNAWKYTGKCAEATIEFGLELRDGEPAYFIRDNGIGFNMDYCGKLFQPFQRLHSDADFPGTGIGLAIVARIIDRHGGRIWAEGRENEGAAFYFTLQQAM